MDPSSSQDSRFEKIAELRHDIDRCCEEGRTSDALHYAESILEIDHRLRFVMYDEAMTQISSVLAERSLVDEAAAIAAKVGGQNHRSRAWYYVAVAASGQGDLEQAARYAELIEEPQIRNEAFIAIGRPREVEGK